MWSAGSVTIKIVPPEDWWSFVRNHQHHNVQATLHKWSCFVPYGTHWEQSFNYPKQWTIMLTLSTELSSWVATSSLFVIHLLNKSSVHWTDISVTASNVCPEYSKSDCLALPRKCDPIHSLISIDFLKYLWMFVTVHCHE